MSTAAAVPQKPRDHAGAMCPKCTGNIMLKEDMYICLQCGTVTGYAIRELPPNDQPYAPSTNRLPPKAPPNKTAGNNPPPPPRGMPGPEPRECVHIKLTPAIPADLTVDHTKTCEPEPSEGGAIMQHHPATAQNHPPESAATRATLTPTADPAPRPSPELDPDTAAPAETQPAPDTEKRPEPTSQRATDPETAEIPPIEDQAQPATTAASGQQAEHQAAQETAPQASTHTERPGEAEAQADQEASQPAQPGPEEPPGVAVSHHDPHDRQPANEEEPNGGAAASHRVEPPIPDDHPARGTMTDRQPEEGQTREPNPDPASDPAPPPAPKPAPAPHPAPIERSDLPYGLTPKEAAQIFGDTAQAEVWFMNKRWPTGVHCPQCTSTALDNRLVANIPAYQCRSCGNTFSMLHDTPLQGTRTPIAKWLLISHALLMNPDSPPNVNQVATEFRTGWITVKKIRDATTESLSKGLSIYQRHPPANPVTGTDQDPVDQRHPPADPVTGTDQDPTDQRRIPDPDQRPSRDGGDQPQPATPATTAAPRSAPDRQTRAASRGNRGESAQGTLEELCKTIELHREILRLRERELYQQAEAAGREILKVEEQLSIIQQSIAISQDWKSKEK